MVLSQLPDFTGKGQPLLGDNNMKFAKVLTLLLLSLVAINASAQTTSGSMSGTIVDTQGQVVPGVDVVITNEQSGEQRRAVTSSVGAFSFPALVPASYTIRAELSGFRPVEVKGNMVLANNRLAVPALVLQVGTLAEAVTVTAVGEAVATTTTAHQALLDLNQVQNLSIRGRDPISLLKILPGVRLLPNDPETFGGSFAVDVPDVSGGRGQTVYVDGINGGDGGSGDRFGGATNIDAIAEVNVQMSAYTAEYGLKGGAQINFITKHGGSEYHGTAYTHQRHQMFNATGYFNKKNNIPKPEYRYSNQGGTLGGPIPKIPKVNPDGGKLFFFYSVDDTQLKNPQGLRRFTVPTALERQGDFSQSRTTSGAPIVVRDPITRQPFPGNRIPSEMAHPAGLAYLNMLPMPNIDAVGYNFVTQEASIPHPRRQHLIRGDYRPTISDSLSVKYQSWYTKSVGINVSAASSRWGLIRQRYDFTADQGKIDYTRVINTSTVLEFATGFFRSTEDGPPENDQQLARIQRRSYPALNALPQFAARHNPLGLIPEATFGTLQNNSFDAPNVNFDGRWPLWGEDSAFNATLNLTHTRGKHTFKMGVMRESEVNGQARSGVFSGEFNFRNDGNDPSNTGFAFANAYVGHVTEYQEDLGRVGDFRIQNTWAWFAQDTWKLTPKITMDIGMRMYKFGHQYHGGGEASAFSFERFDPKWGGNPPVLFRPVRVDGQRRAQNPITGEILPSNFIGLMVEGTGFTCGVITPENPCKVNGIVLQDDPTYRKGDFGFIDPIPIQFDPRFGVAWAPTPKMVVRASTGIFHNGTGGPLHSGGLAYRFTRRIFFTDLNSYSAGAAAGTVSSTSGTERTGHKRPSTHKYTVGVQRDMGWKLVADVAYVGEFTRYLGDDFNYNPIPAGARFRPENRDLSQPDSTTVGLQPGKPSPGALPNDFLRPIIGFGDININRPVNSARYDSLQTQISRRFTGGVELSGAYTFARSYTLDSYQGNPLTGTFRDYDNDMQDHVFVASYVIDVPDGSRLLGNSAVSRALLDNWQLSGISTFASGPWSEVTASHTDSFDFSGGGETYANYVLVADPNKNAPHTEDQWFDTSVFQRPSGRGDLGNEAAGVDRQVERPGFHNHDLTVSKNFRLPRNHRITFKAEVYNLFNQVSWNEIDLSAQFDAAGNQTDRNFGRVNSARNERRMVFSLRYTF